MASLIICSNKTLKRSTLCVIAFVVSVSFLSNYRLVLTPRYKSQDEDSKIRRIQMLASPGRIIKVLTINYTTSTPEDKHEIFHGAPTTLNNSLVDKGDNSVDNQTTRSHFKRITVRPSLARTANDTASDTLVKTLKRFEARRSMILCESNLKFYNLPKRPSYTHVSNRYFQVCSVRKIASSFFLDLNKKLERENSSWSSNRNGTVTRKTPRLVVVRDPFSRMVSGYIDRVLINPQKLILFSREDVKEFWPNATMPEAEARCGNVVGFPQFVKYFIHFRTTGKWMDNHFRPMSHQCDPCKEKFDFIVHLETLTEDMAFIFQALRIVTAFPSSESDSIFGQSQRLKKWQRSARPCQTRCEAFRNLWWSFQARGLIPRDRNLPWDGQTCERLPTIKFGHVTWKVYQENKGKFDKMRQKRQMMAELFLRVPVQDRLKIRDLLARDFLLFGYDSLPRDLFPELFNENK